jgi:putative DNA primase/helicase
MKTSIEEIKANLNFRDIFKEYFPEQYQAHGNSHCPFHDDRNPSFMVTNDHGICYAGCTPDSRSKRWDVIDLHERRFSVSRNEALKELAKRGWVDAGSKPTTIKGQLVKVYDYHDGQGSVVYSKCRYQPKSFSWCRPDPDNSNKNITGLGAVKRHLYNLPAILSSLPETPVVFCEGEKDADALSELGFVSTTVGSSQGWLKLVRDHEVHKPLTGRTVWIIPDKDEPGRKFGIQVAATLQPVCRVVKLFELPGDGIKDSFDFISQIGKDSHRLISELAAKTPVWEAKVSDSAGSYNRHNVTSDETERLSKYQRLNKCLDESGSELFLDQFGVPWANVKIGDHRENVSVRSERFTNLLRNQFSAQFDEGIGDDLIRQALGARIGAIEAYGEIRELHYRVAWASGKDKILIDSGRPDWSVYEIGPDAWRLTRLDTNPFKREPDFQPYDCEEHTPRSNWADLFNLLSVDDSNIQGLIKIWLTLALYPDTVRPGLVINGSPGCGKTTFAWILRDIVDPHGLPPAGLPKDLDNFILALYKNYIPCFDNINRLSIEQSDILCQAITGISHPKRKLWTDSDLVSFRIKCPWILTGVAMPGHMSDFLNRIFSIELKPIPVDQRRPDDELAEMFDKIRPQLQAMIFDCISAGLKNRNKVKPQELQRLAQAHKLSLAMADALELTAQEINELWALNRQEQESLTTEGDILSTLLPEFMAANSNHWVGTSTELLNQMAQHFEVERQSWKGQWPKDAANLGKRLSYLTESLQAKGIVITDNKGAVRKKTITYTPPKEIQGTVNEDSPSYIPLTNEQKAKRIEKWPCKQCDSFNSLSGTCSELKPSVNLDHPDIRCPRCEFTIPNGAYPGANLDHALGQVM